MHVEDRWTRPTGRADSRGRAIRERTERYGRGLRWLATWTESGKRFSKSFATADAARAHIAGIAKAKQEGTLVQTHKLTLAQYGDQWIATQIHQRPSTRDQMMSRWTKHIRPTLGHIPLKEINRQHVQAAVQKWSNRLAPSTVGVIYGYVAAILKSAAQDKMIGQSPCVGINLPRREGKRVVPLTVTQVWEIADRIDRRLRFMVILGAASGMRSGEMRGLTLDRIRWDQLPSPVLPTATIRIDRQLVASSTPDWDEPKTERSDRTISIDARTMAAYREHLAEFPPGADGLIFTAAKGGGFARNVISEAWADATAGMGLPPRTGLHALRHHHASLLIAAGLSVTAVADRLGHQDPTQTLQVYSHLWPTDEERARDAVLRGLWATDPG